VPEKLSFESRDAMKEPWALKLRLLKPIFFDKSSWRHLRQIELFDSAEFGGGELE